MGTLTYDSNNSGGDWWLKDEDWHALAAAGWTVDWKADHEGEEYSMVRGGRFLGALASDATKEFATAREGIEEWERITGQYASELGCFSCCGPPHNFRWEDGDERRYISPDAPQYGEMDY